MSRLAHFTDGAVETQREEVTCPRSRSKVVAERGPEHRSLTCRPVLRLPPPLCSANWLLHGVRTAEQVDSGWAGCHGTLVWPQPISHASLVSGTEEADLADPATWGV